MLYLFVLVSWAKHHRYLGTSSVQSLYLCAHQICILAFTTNIYQHIFEPGYCLHFISVLREWTKLPKSLHVDKTFVVTGTTARSNLSRQLVLHGNVTLYACQLPLIELHNMFNLRFVGYCLYVRTYTCIFGIRVPGLSIKLVGSLPSSF